MEATPYIFVYQTICNVNGKSYVGVHKTNDLNDGYIGCGIYKDNDARLNLLFHRAVRKYGYNSFRKYILDFYDTYEEALDEERFVVNKNWIKNKNNYNSAIGGSGSTTSWMCEMKKEEWKDKIRNSVNHWINNGGREILIEKQKKSKKVIKYGKDHHCYGKISPKIRAVIQYTTDLKFVKKFLSIKDCVKETGFSAGNIVSCCIGYYKICNGFIFRYEKYSDSEIFKFNQNSVKKAGNRRKVSKVDKDGNELYEYESIRKAAKENSCSVASITKCVSGSMKSCKGMFFKYKNL